MIKLFIMKNLIVLFCLVINHLVVRGQSITIDSILDHQVHYVIGVLGDGPKESFRHMKPIFNDDQEKINAFFTSLELIQVSDTDYIGRNYFNYQLQLFNKENFHFEHFMFSIYPEDAIVIINENYYTFDRKALYDFIRHSKKIDQEVYWLNDIEKIRKFHVFLIETNSTYFTTDFLFKNRSSITPIRADSTYLKYDGSVYLQVEYPSDLSEDEQNKLINDKAQQAVLKDSCYYLQNYSWSWYDSNTIEKHRFFIHTDQETLRIPLDGVIDPWSPYTIKFFVHSEFNKKIKSYYEQLQE